MSDYVIKPKYKYVFVLILLILIISFASCTQSTSAETQSQTAAIEVTPTPTAKPTDTPEPTATPYVWTAEFKEPKILGSSRGIFCAVTTPAEAFDEIGFVLESDGSAVFEQAAVLFEDDYYIQIDNLDDDTQYTLKMYYSVGDNKTYTGNELRFSTPEKIYSDEEVDNILIKALKGTEYTEGTNKYYNAQTKRALQLLEINIAGSLGSGSYYLQMNQIKLEYSFNSYGRYVNWDMVDSYCDENTLTILKDIVSVSDEITEESFFYPFVPTPHTLVAYNKFDEEGGQFDAERYLYDSLLDIEEIYNWYAEYPFIYDTPEFQQKYADLIEENAGADELSIELQTAVAHNKFMFSFYNRPFMDEYAVPQERTIRYRYIGELVVPAATAYAYLITEVPDGYEKLFMNESTRDYSTQASFYTRKAGMARATEFSPEWHLERQEFSYVPGFSNHHYGIAIDFNEIQTFRQTQLYPYLQDNAERYGFYNYLIEPWHWTYMGE